MRSEEKILTIPNILSLFRLILIPVYVYIYLNATKASDYYIAAGILIVSTLTDAIDGIVARKFNMISKLGKILDPIADKATQGILMICLSLKYDKMSILFIFFVIKEGFMTIMGIINLKRGRMLKGAHFSGKVCTTVLFVSMILLVLVENMPETIVNSLIIISGIFMCISLFNYASLYFKKDNKFEEVKVKEII